VRQLVIKVFKKITTLSVCKMFLSHSIYYQHGSVSVSTIISVNYKNITNSKICHNIEANHSMLQSLSQTFYTVNENQLIY